MNIELFLSPIIDKGNQSNYGQLVYLNDANFYLGEIYRFYSIFNVKSGEIRGNHAHKELQQLLFCAYGRIKLTLVDGNEIVDVILDHPSKILYVGPMIWRTMEWLVDDSVLVVLASDNYNESDYIRNYNEFLRLVGNEKNTL